MIFKRCDKKLTGFHSLVTIELHGLTAVREEIEFHYKPVVY